MIAVVNATALRCDQPDAGGRCPARLLVEGQADAAATRRAAVERGWTATDGRDLCPRHRDGAGS